MSNELIKDLSTSKSKQEIIRLLASGGATSISEIAKKIGRDKSTISRHADELEEAGLIYRKMGPLNKRKRYLSLTDKGQEAARRLR